MNILLPMILSTDSLGSGTVRTDATEPVAVFQEYISPPREVVSIETSCDSYTFRIAIVNMRSMASELVETSRDGRAFLNGDDIARLRQFLATVRTVHFGGSVCISENEVEFGLRGLLLAPSPGADEDLIRNFRVRFPTP